MPGEIDLIKQHRVKLTSDEPIWSHPYPVLYSVRTTLQKELNDMLKMNIIQESRSPYSSPIVIVKKRDSTNRLCVDFRKLNKITEVDPEPTNTVVETIQNLSTDKWFSKIDLTKGYWQVPLVKEDVYKTAFSSSDGSYKFLRMPFGMVNSGATLMRAMRIPLEGMENVEHVADNILIHNVTWEEHLGTLQELLQRTSAAGRTARHSKTVIGAHAIDFAGYRVGHVLPVR